VTATSALPGRSLLEVLRERVVVADGAMGTMLQAADLGLDDFEGHEGCNEILNVTRPDVVRGVHDAYFAVGCDAVETNTFGSNYANLAEYDIVDRIRETALAGARVARASADAWSTPDRPRWVLGSVGPGTKLPTLGHAPYPLLRDAYQEQCTAMIEGGVDAVLIETSQDLLQTKAAVVGARRAMTATGRRVALIAQVTVELTGTMLLGSEIGAALTALEPLGIDVVGMNCATGPAEMSEHLRYLSQHARIPLSVMPNAGLPQLGKEGAVYPLQPGELADALEEFTTAYGVGLVGGCCGTTPEHLRQVVDRVRGREVRRQEPVVEPGAASLYAAVPFRQDAGVLMVGERTNTNGSRAFRDAMLAADWEKVVDIGREAVREGAHLIDLCVDYVGRDGALDMREAASRFATASTLPVMLDSTEPPVIEAGLECLGGRAVINSVNFEDGEGPDSRFARVMPIVREHGAAVVALCIDEEGQARTPEWKVRVAERLIDTLTGQWGMDEGDILLDTLTFTLGTGQEESRKDGAATIEAIRELSQRHPRVGTVLGLSNISFGLKPAARVVLNSVFLHECQKAGLTSAIVHASKILPLNRIPADQLETALDLIYDRRRAGDDAAGVAPYDPLTHFLDLFEGVEADTGGKSRHELLMELPLDERLQRRIVDGEKNGLEADLDAAMAAGRPPLAIVNDTLLSGMKVVGELFGSGEMQLPFVLQSAEVMKTAVAHLEPHMDKVEGSSGKGTMVLATVKGDVHDIGKNLVDIILSNNGYTVVNLGIKQPVTAILDAAQEHDADVIGMSGLLVKSTVVMKENLLEMNSRGISSRFPVILGGAALTRAYVEQDLDEVFDGDVRYARDAFEGLRLMDALMAAKRGEVPAEQAEADQAKDAERRARHARSKAIAETRRRTEQEPEPGGRSDVATDNAVPTPPFWGSRVSKGIALADYASWLDERALFLGQWGLRGSRGGSGPTYEQLVETEGRPRLRELLAKVQAEGVMQAAVVHGYYPAVSKDDDLIVLDPDSGNERCRFTFPRQRRDRRLCLSDFFRAEETGQTDVVAFHVVTMGRRVSEVANELFARNAYRDYLELHGLSVQLTEALAESWHARVRAEFGFAADDSPDLQAMLSKQAYRGSRYSFGYPACPDVEDQDKLEVLLDWKRIGVELSEEHQLTPEQSTSAIIVHHPEAKYFAAR
jgi:5-methyltetrahydrofolate--homocysteine methyltransferase